MKKILLPVFLFLLSSNLFSQYRIGLIPRVSPDRGVYEKIGFTEIEIKYGSPSVKDRVIWGDLEPYGKVWRAGANNATVISISEAIKINGEVLEAGQYAFFIIPEKEEDWTVIFSKKSKQWGAFRYQESDDVLRLKVKVIKQGHQEQLKYSIQSKSVSAGLICLEWEKIKIQLNIETDNIKVFQQKIENQLADAPENTKWVTLIQGAEYLVDEGEELELAKVWLTQSEALYPKEGEWNKQYYPKQYILGHFYWTFAKLYGKQEKYQQALEYVGNMKALTGEKNFFESEKSAKMLSEIQVWKEGMKK